MIAEIITIGSEITTGSTLNTNTFYLSQRLFEMGIETYYHTSVDDDENRLEDIIKIALGRSNLIITTGGLGPTKDDLTKEVISKVLGLELELDNDMKKNIESMFERIGTCLTSNNIKQAIKPKGSSFIDNSIGTAPGIYIEKDNKKIIMLPGPPREMSLMFDNHVKDLIHDNFNIISRSLNTTGIGESSLESRLQELNLSSTNINIATYAREGTVEVKIVGKGKDKQKIELEVDAIFNALNEEFNSFIYGYDNISLEEVVVNELKAKGYKLGLCESCTGGLVSSMITRVPGASNVLERAIVSYSNTSKIEVLDVKASTLKEFGAVSQETAYEMAKGLFNKAKLDIVVSITGIAGPDGGSDEKPIGLVYYCVMTKDGHNIIKSNFNGDRGLVQRRAAIKALNEIRKICKNNN
ncbi:MAG TPA: competence/damage-inducible protein A [Tissierellaceae bacterium]|nr:competence/damage-inducible protein A [Tissierellaceae bacterium]